jgi:hypothetical protein
LNTLLIAPPCYRGAPRTHAYIVGHNSLEVLKYTHYENPVQYSFFLLGGRVVLNSVPVQLPSNFKKQMGILWKHMWTSSYTKATIVGSKTFLDFVENSKLMGNAIQTTVSIVFKVTTRKNS